LAKVAFSTKFCSSVHWKAKGYCCIKNNESCESEGEAVMWCKKYNFLFAALKSGEVVA
jgi:hypothetical protein